MSWSVQTNVVDVARLIYPDLTPTDAVTYLNIVRAEVLRKLRLYATTSSINLTAGTQEYTLTSSIARIDAVEYHRSATASDFIALMPTSLAYLEADEPRFRGYSNAEPKRFYLAEGTTGPKIGLVPAPDTTTSGGYPVLTIYESAFNTLALIDTFYDDLPNCTVYTRGIAKEFAEKNDTANYPMRKTLYEEALAQAQDYLFKKNQNLATRMQPSWMKPRGVI